MATLAPLYALDRNKGALTTLKLENIDVFRVIAEVLDAVIAEMSGPNEGATYELLLALIAPRVRQLDPAFDDAQIDRLLSYIIDGLINQKERDSFRSRYQHEADDGTVRWVPFSFKLLKEVDPAGRGEVRYQATSEAINIYLASFAVDIEAAQAADEAMVHHFVKHGRHHDAGLAAKNALDRSVQYRVRLRQALGAIERSIVAINYESDFAPIVRDARRHLGERIATEGELLGMVEERLPSAGNDDRHHLAITRDLIQRAMHQHAGLSTEIISANARFLNELLRQRFRRAPSVMLADPFVDITKPLLLTPIGRLDEWFQEAPFSFFGIAAPRPAHLAELADLLLQDLPVTSTDNQIVKDSEIVSDEQPPRFSPEQIARLRKFLGNVQLPCKLSGLLADARHADLDTDTMRLLIVQVSFWFGGGSEGGLQIERNGAHLHDPEFYGHDLILARNHG